MNPPDTPNTIYPCFFCNTHTIVPVRFAVPTQKDGTAVVYCKRHRRELRKHAPLVVIEWHRFYRIQRPGRKLSFKKAKEEVKYYAKHGPFETDIT